MPAFSAAEALLFGLINFGEATFAFLLLRRLGFDARFATLADAWKFLVAGPLAAAFARLAPRRRRPAAGALGWRTPSCSPPRSSP